MKTKVGNDRSPVPMEIMLRIYFLQQWCALGDQAAEELLYDMESMRNFTRLQMVEDVILDESTILKFRHPIEKHELCPNLVYEKLKRSGLSGRL